MALYTTFIRILCVILLHKYGIKIVNNFEKKSGKMT